MKEVARATPPQTVAADALRQAERWDSLAIQLPGDAIEVVSATYAAWNAGDWGLERFHPQVEWDLAALDQAGPRRGRDALLHYWRRFWGLGSREPGGRSRSC
jgi:hypothetical protein